MRSSLLLLWLLPASFGCLPDAPCDGETITVHPNYTSIGDGTYRNEPCAGNVGSTGTYTITDAEACCPDDYSFVSVASDGGIICQRDCKAAAVSSTQDFVYIATETLETLETATETLYAPTP